jgi:hypothetical protein
LFELAHTLLAPVVLIYSAVWIVLRQSNPSTQVKPAQHARRLPQSRPRRCPAATCLVESAEARTSRTLIAWPCGAPLLVRRERVLALRDADLHVSKRALRALAVDVDVGAAAVTSARAPCAMLGPSCKSIGACSSDCIVQAAAAADRRVADLEIHLLYSIHSSRSWGVVLANYRLAHLLSSYSCWRFFL